MINNCPTCQTKLLLLPVLFAFIQACTPMIHPSGVSVSACRITNNLYITTDATELQLKTWKTPQQKTDAVIIALHGFNDYSHFFQQPGIYFSQHKIASYAYDQRGFGGSLTRGLWAGIDTYIDDLTCFVNQVTAAHPNIPIYLLGESMGGAIVISTVVQSTQPAIKGIILAAPAIWARRTMPWYQNTLLWTLSHTVPWLTLTGDSLEIIPSDNIEMLRALSKDPLIIKETRVESIYGLVNLMDHALSSTKKISTKTLLLYGEKDEIIPKEPTYQFLQGLKNNSEKHTVAFYENGYHMLLRDLQASIVWKDITAWINSDNTPLPSGADKRTKKILDHP
ncbi:MAG: lysophospholipase [Methylococcales bacterium]|nr:lysophospholipase [Methylococcales bacterium]